jgi:hypothetical protein
METFKSVKKWLAHILANLAQKCRFKLVYASLIRRKEMG